MYLNCLLAANRLVCVYHAVRLKTEWEWTQTLRERAGVDTNIAGAGGSGTRRLRELAVLVRNSAGVGGCGFKKTVLRRAL